MWPLLSVCSSALGKLSGTPKETEPRALSLWHGPCLRERGRKEWRGWRRTAARKIPHPYPFTGWTLPISPVSFPSPYSLSAEGNRARCSTGEDTAAARLWDPVTKATLFPLSLSPPTASPSASHTVPVMGEDSGLGRSSSHEPARS